LRISAGEHIRDTLRHLGPSVDRNEESGDSTAQGVQHFPQIAGDDLALELALIPRKESANRGNDLDSACVEKVDKAFLDGGPYAVVLLIGELMSRESLNGSADDGSPLQKFRSSAPGAFGKGCGTWGGQGIATRRIED